MLITRRAYKDLMDTMRFADIQIKEINDLLNRAGSSLRDCKNELDKRDAQIEGLSTSLVDAKWQIARLIDENSQLKTKIKIAEGNV